MKRIVILFLMSMCNIYLLNATECSCGSFQDGQYDFSVEDQPNEPGKCCSSPVTGNAWFSTYTPGEGSTWELFEIIRVEPATAQKKCCPST
jgi:hypothetical protein